MLHFYATVDWIGFDCQLSNERTTCQVQSNETLQYSIDAILMTNTHFSILYSTLAPLGRLQLCCTRLKTSPRVGVCHDIRSTLEYVTIQRIINMPNNMQNQLNYSVEIQMNSEILQFLLLNTRTLTLLHFCDHIMND